jgi:hypothetical protein
MKRPIFPLTANTSLFRNLATMTGLAAILLLAPAASQAQITLGLQCAQDFQNKWAPGLGMDSLCKPFAQTVALVASKDWYYNLHGAQPAFYSGTKQETCSSCGGLDSVDFAFVATHGNVPRSTYTGFAMWDDSCADTNPPGCIAWTPYMRLGSVGRQLKVLSAYACDTLKVSDGDLIARWGKIFAGGLRIATGGYDVMWSGSQNGEIGLFYGIYLGVNLTVTNAWLDATSLDTSNHPISVVTGANANDCWNRQGMTLKEAVSSKPLRDNEIGYYCWVYWQ